jgi:hypothetical protein
MAVVFTLAFFAFGRSVRADTDTNMWTYASVNSDGTINAAYSGPGIKVTRLQPGLYDILIIGPAVDAIPVDASVDASQPGPVGVAQVTAVGVDDTRCSLYNSPDIFLPSGFGDPKTIEFSVFCTRPSNSAGTDSAFMFAFTRRTDESGAVEGGYATVGAYPASVFPLWLSPDASQWNSTGQGIVVDRYDVGAYDVVFQGQDFIGGTAQVTAIAYGAAGLLPGNVVLGAYCEVEGWWPDGNGDQEVLVDCWDGTGAPADAAFNVGVTYGSPSGATEYAYAWADQPDSLSSYLPDPQYQGGVGNCGALGGGTLSGITSGPFSSLPGSYGLTFPNMYSYAAFNAGVMVTAFGYSGEYCKIGGFGASGNADAYATVYCFDYAGRRASALFTINYSLYYQPLVC